MKKYIIFLFTLIIIPVLAYEVYTPETFYYKESGDKLLFVIDFSNSMGEHLEHKSKVESVKTMMQQILPQISSDTKVGVRVYGHTCNVLAYNACRSSELVVPLGVNNSTQINNSLLKLKPKGMTPITYSLTDGGENCDESPCDYAIDLVKKRRDIKIDVVAFNVSNSDDLDQLRCTADVTGGHFIETNTNAEMVYSMENLILPHKNVEAQIYKQDY